MLILIIIAVDVHWVCERLTHIHLWHSVATSTLHHIWHGSTHSHLLELHWIKHWVLHSCSRWKTWHTRHLRWCSAWILVKLFDIFLTHSLNILGLYQLTKMMELIQFLVLHQIIKISFGTFQYFSFFFQFMTLVLKLSKLSFQCNFLFFQIILDFLVGTDLFVELVYLLGLCLSLFLKSDNLLIFLSILLIQYFILFSETFSFFFHIFYLHIQFLLRILYFLAVSLRLIFFINQLRVHTQFAFNALYFINNLVNAD